MPISDVKIRREMQRKCKADERALTKQLVNKLDALLPYGQGSLPADPQLSKRKGTLPSRRNQLQLLRDAILHVQSAAKRPTGQELMEGLLSTWEDRMVVVELSTWRIQGMSEKLKEDFKESMFASTMVGQVLLHYVDYASADRLRCFSQTAEMGGLGAQHQGTCQSLAGVDVKMRLFRKHNVVHASFKYVPTTVTKGICVFHVVGSTEDIRDPDWSRVDMSWNEGVVQFSKEESTATPWFIERAMSCITHVRKRFIGWILPTHETQQSSSQVCDWMKTNAESRFTSLQRGLHDLMFTHQDVHFLCDGSSGDFPTLCVHIRFCLPQFMGGIRTPWVKLLQRKLDGSAFAPFSDNIQEVRLYPVWEEGTTDLTFVAFYVSKAEGTCFHTRIWTLSRAGFFHQGHVFRTALEEPYRYHFFFKKVAEADRTLMPEVFE
mmetsp:Transcript_12193/g.42408  ORF Transcript_12193/g.42408 Transcript_12193/m.42408 type:complete len:434 (-) Transcript_12193:344-1645(-)